MVELNTSEKLDFFGNVVSKPNNTKNLWTGKLDEFLNVTMITLCHETTSMS